MLPGFNTDIEHNGVTYHVQTEDKGHDSPLILSLIYTGGTILASKRTPYEDLLIGGLDERLLAERLNRQHTLICAAIRAGRIEDLKRSNEKGKNAAQRAQEIEQPATQKPQVVGTSTPPAVIPPTPAVTREGTGVPDLKAVADRTLISLTSDALSPLGTGPLNRNIGGLQLHLLSEPSLKAGEPAVFHLKVGCGLNGAEPAANAEVSIKILGTTFQPVVINLKTNELGVAAARVNLPQFNAGRAAILVRAEFRGQEAMLRRVIQRF